MKRRTYEAVSRTRASRGAAALMMALAACSDTDGAEHAHEREGQDAGSERDAALMFPASEQVCSLAVYTSVESDIRGVFGEPSEVQAGDERTLRYSYDDQTHWLFFFDADRVWTGFTMQSDGSATATAPTCWAPDGGYWQRPDGGYWQRPDGGYRNW